MLWFVALFDGVHTQRNQKIIYIWAIIEMPTWWKCHVWPESRNDLFLSYWTTSCYCVIITTWIDESSHCRVSRPSVLVSIYHKLGNNPVSAHCESDNTEKRGISNCTICLISSVYEQYEWPTLIYRPFISFFSLHFQKNSQILKGCLIGIILIILMIYFFMIKYWQSRNAQVRMYLLQKRGK